jgi:CDP-diacylglycerol--glycerol-3-phosphate 3-phosphatidyltransferase
MAAVAAVVIGSGHLFIGAVLLTLAALPDLLDGAVAKASGTASPRGAFFDSVADRVTDSLILGGIAWHLALTKGGLYPMLPFAALGTSTLISYQRAKAESLGYDAKGGLMERAERIVAIGAGLVFSVLLIPILWVMVALTSVTAVQRFVKVWRQASKPLPVRNDRPDLSERWRAWREARELRESPTMRSVVDWRSRSRSLGGRDNRRRERTWRRGAGNRRP